MSATDNVKRILCPLDFSDGSQAINEYASMLAKAMNATLVYLHVALPDVPYMNQEYFDVNEVMGEDLRLLKKFQPAAPGIQAEWEIVAGPPEVAIAKFAQENAIDLIVMGTHGRTGMKRMLMGSIAESVIRHAECPVVAVRTLAPVPEQAG